MLVLMLILVVGLLVVLVRLEALEAQGEVLMATVQDLEQKFVSLNEAITAERAEVQGMLTKLRDEIALLMEQIGNGQLVTQEQLDNLDAAAALIVARVSEISEPEPAPEV